MFKVLVIRVLQGQIYGSHHSFYGSHHSFKGRIILSKGRIYGSHHSFMEVV